MKRVAAIRSSARTAVFLVVGVLVVSVSCAAPEYALPTDAERAEFERATDDDVAAAADLPLTDEAIYAHLEQFLTNHPTVYGSTFALDPAYAGGPLAPYVYRQNGGFVRRSLATASYDYPRQPWFADPMQADASEWSEPYVDTGGGETTMVTYSAPVRKGGQTIGILTADFALGDAGR